MRIMWVFGWPFYADRAAKQAREWGFVPPDASDVDASQHMLTRIYCLKNSRPARFIPVDMDGEWRPIIALCSDENAKRKEDATIPREIPPFITCLKIQKCLGIPDGQAPQWYWTDDDDDDEPDDYFREYLHITVCLVSND